jgi:hypothetical protein
MGVYTYKFKKFIAELLEGPVKRHFTEVYALLDDIEELLKIAYEDEGILGPGYEQVRRVFDEMKGRIFEYEEMFQELMDLAEFLEEEAERKEREWLKRKEEMRKLKEGK